MDSTYDLRGTRQGGACASPRPSSSSQPPPPNSVTGPRSAPGHRARRGCPCPLPGESPPAPRGGSPVPEPCPPQAKPPPPPPAVAWSASVTPGGPGRSGVQGGKGDPLASVRAWHLLTHSSTHPPTLPSFHSSLADASSESAPQPCPQAGSWKPALTRGGRSAGQRSAPGASRDLLLGGWTARKTLE